MDINYLLTSFDGGYIHQGCWGWGGDVAGTAGSRTWVAVQSRLLQYKPLNTLTEFPKDNIALLSGRGLGYGTQVPPLIIVSS